MSFYKRISYIDIELKSGEVLRVEDLRIEFQIEKTKDETPNKAEIKITNLSEEIRTKIKEKDALVRVFAGYEQDIGAVLIFTGNSQHLINRWQTPDIVTTIEAQEEIRLLRETRVSFSFQNETPANLIINKIANEFGLPLRNDFDIDGTYQGFSFNGLAKDALDKVTKRFNYKWSIENGELIIVPKFGSLDIAAVKLTATSGLINTPERLIDQEGEFEEALEKELEWKIQSLLNPRLSPGGLVELESKQANGVFQIETVKHVGDTRGQSWYSELELKSRD